MHPIVPIIMTLGVITFLSGLFIYTQHEIKQRKIITLRGKDYRSWKFLIMTIGLGIALIMCSIFIHKQFPYQPEQNNSEEQTPLSHNLKYELESIVPDFENSPLSGYIKRFQKEYHNALSDDDEATMGLLSLEMESHIETILKEQDRSPADVKHETKRIMKFLTQPTK